MVTNEERWNNINRKLSAAFLLTNMAYTLIEDAEEDAMYFGGFKHALKLYLKKSKKGMDEYFSIIRREADRQGKTMDFFEDFEHLEKMVSKFIGYDKEREDGCDTTNCKQTE